MKLYIKVSQHRKMMAYAKEASPFEIGGLCAVEKVDNENAFKVIDVCIVKQEVFHSHFELDDEAQVELDMERMTKKLAGDLMMMWHSHVKMAVFPSSDDSNRLKAKAKEGATISLIMNLSGEISCRYASTVSDEYGITMYAESKIDVVLVEDTIDLETIKKEVKDKIIPPKKQVVTHPAGVGVCAGRSWYNDHGTIKAKGNPQTPRQINIPRSMYHIRKDFEGLPEEYQDFIRKEAGDYGHNSNNAVLKYYEENYSEEIGNA